MKQAMLGAVLAAAMCGTATADQVTFTKDVLPILQENCQQCHRHGGDNIAGMVAPMSLITYEETRPWAKAIARAVQSKSMPPWFTTEAYSGIFHNERALTDAEIETIVTWTDTGARRGKAEDAPPALTFDNNGGWFAGEPDLLVKMPEPYWVADDLEDQYVNFVTEPLTKEQLSGDRWLKSIEWRGDSEAVHHIVGAYSLAPAEEGEEPERFELGSIAPGEEGTIYPEGFGKLMREGARIHFNMHYHKEPGPGTGVWDQSMGGFSFWDAEMDPPVTRAVERNGISNFLFEIPPNHPNWEVGAAKTFEKDTLLMALHPHMHLRGKDAKYVAVYPDGTRETLLEVPAFDFNWQLDYSYAEPKLIPAGTRVEFTAHYDNSVNNPYNPDNTIPMKWGGPTTSEMMIGYVSYCDAEPTVTLGADVQSGD